MKPISYLWLILDVYGVIDMVKTSIRMIGPIFWYKMTEIQTTWILSQYQIGQI